MNLALVRSTMEIPKLPYLSNLWKIRNICVDYPLSYILLCLDKSKGKPKKYISPGTLPALSSIGGRGVIE